jgi:hypothetical protein
MPKEDVDAALGNGPANMEIAPPPGTRAAAIAKDIIERSTASFVQVQQPGLNMTLKRGCL